VPLSLQLEKIFDIGCSLADVLQLYPALPQTAALSMEVGPRDYLIEILRVLSTVLGGSTRYLPMLAAKVDECTTQGIRAALEPGSGRVVDLGDEETAYSESMETEPGVEGFNTNGYSESGMFDFGTLSEASMAWLGSMSDDSFGDITGMNEQPLYQPG
jgi:hypothetical protein